MKVAWYLFVASFLSFLVYVTIDDGRDQNSERLITPTEVIETLDPAEQENSIDGNQSFFRKDAEQHDEYILDEETDEQRLIDTYGDNYLEEDSSPLYSEFDYNEDDIEEFYGTTSKESDGYLGQYTKNKYESDRINPSDYLDDKYSSDGPKLYDDDGNFRGNLNGNKYDSDSVSNPYGQYGSKYSSDSINNPYGAGSKYDSDSPNNPYGDGWSVFED